MFHTSTLNCILQEICHGGSLVPQLKDVLAKQDLAKGQNDVSWSVKKYQPFMKLFSHKK
jgi:hypothetical protein